MFEENPYPKKVLHDGISYFYENNPGDIEEEIRKRFWRIREGEVAMDIGCHTGVYTLDALARGADFVWAFDPNLELCRSLRQNIHVNKWGDRCSVNCLALWSRSKDMRYSIRKAMLEEEDDGDSREVKTISLDEFIKNLSIQPSRLNWIKIDTEGAEVQILAGAVLTLLKYKPNLLIEVHNVVQNKPTENLEAIQGLLEGFGLIPEIVTEGDPSKDTHHILVKIVAKKI